jgi:uncharacterized membrane protein YphA (DoxX/SURF4 family)
MISKGNLARWAPLPLRLIVGYGFMAHGYAKLAKGPDTFVDILYAIGVPAPHFMAWLTIIVELPGGLAVLLWSACRWQRFSWSPFSLSICHTVSPRSNSWP